jgi:hypothetical protein
LIAAGLTVAWSSIANAVLIPTNVGKGADAEVRESQFTAADLAGSFSGINNGVSTELSTRLSTSQSSISFVKFDISSLPGSSDSFWDDKETVSLNLYVRQNGNFKLFPDGTNLAGDPADLTFSIYTLDPNGTYDGNRTDRVGNNYTATYNQYDWVEGTGAQTGISFYDAPGIQPFCMNANSCGGPTFDSTRGVYDDFDSNAIYLGDYVPEAQYPDGVDLAAGSRLFINDSFIKQAVFAALDAGEDTVTFMVHHKGPQADTVQAALGRNYNMTPKEHLLLQGTLDNSFGAYSPQLHIAVPEPASLVMLGLGCLGCLVVRRRG